MRFYVVLLAHPVVPGVVEYFPMSQLTGLVILQVDPLCAAFVVLTHRVGVHPLRFSSEYLHVQIQHFFVLFSHGLIDRLKF